MEGFHLIQYFFTQMTCRFCESTLSEDGVELVRQEEDVFIVNVHCTRCNKQMGVAMVGMESAEYEEIEEIIEFDDPELSLDEVVRFAEVAPVTYDDVIAAHQVFNGPDEAWRGSLRQRIHEYQTGPGWEFQTGEGLL